MSAMIMCTPNRGIEVGKVYTPACGITDGEGVLHPPQPAFIVREATYEEWAAQSEKHALWSPDPDFRYYEVLID